MVVVILASLSMSMSGAHAAGGDPAATADVPSAVAPVSTPPTSEAPPSSAANDFLDLERSLTECISSNPPPGCGRVPTGPGDRGGWQQFVLFGVMMTGIAVIFWRVSRAVRGRNAVQSDNS